METAGKHVCPQTLSLTGRFGEPQGNHSANEMRQGELRVKVSLVIECSILTHWAVLYLYNPQSFEILVPMFGHFETVTLKLGLFVKFNVAMPLIMRS